MTIDVWSYSNRCWLKADRAYVEWIVMFGDELNLSVSGAIIRDLMLAGF